MTCLTPWRSCRNHCKLSRGISATKYKPRTNSTYTKLILSTRRIYSNNPRKWQDSTGTTIKLLCCPEKFELNIDTNNKMVIYPWLSEDSSNSIANALEILQSCTKATVDDLVQDCSNSTGVNIKACPGHVDLVPGHLNFCGYVPDWASDFSAWACTYFFSSIYKLYRACTNIGWACQNFCSHKWPNPKYNWDLLILCTR